MPTATFEILYVFVIIWHKSRKVVHFNVTEHPTARWTAQQIVEACPFDTLPKYLLRDRDSIYGEYFQFRLKNMGINQVKSAPQSPWEYRASFSIDSFEITNGEFPRKQKRLVQAWAELHIDELKANWKLAMNEEPVYKINPL
jgi:hypothetical protein